MAAARAPHVGGPALLDGGGAPAERPAGVGGALSADDGALRPDPARRARSRPLLLLVAGLFRLIDSIKAFPLIYILTDGGPGNLTEVTNYYSFLQAFNFSYLGFSSAITVVLLAATILLSWVIIRVVGWGVRVD